MDWITGPRLVYIPNSIHTHGRDGHERWAVALTLTLYDFEISFAVNLPSLLNSACLSYVCSVIINLHLQILYHNCRVTTILFTFITHALFSFPLIVLGLISGFNSNEEVRCHFVNFKQPLLLYQAC